VAGAAPIVPNASPSAAAAMPYEDLPHLQIDIGFLEPVLKTVAQALSHSRVHWVEFAGSAADLIAMS
jgi:hypothetical protein